VSEEQREAGRLQTSLEVTVGEYRAERARALREMTNLTKK
jgi:hypothetical protein